ncbi:hypothetical protein AB0C88_37635 [Streptomyces chartreusis]|uniref:hypothetical protein n=1 Tax=Streptomyces chartreusis TaxID=1969 RepID=UPI00340B43E6
MTTNQPDPTPEDDDPHAANRRPHNGAGRFERSIETAQRDARAAELRAENYTYQQIADELGWADKSDARKAVRRALREIVQGPAEALLANHMERLETLYERALDIAERQHVVVSYGQIVRGDDGEPLKDPGPELAALREARATLDSFWTLTGMKKPAKVEHSGGVKYEVVGIDPDSLT